jgi:vacuolar iron transporter family protein
LGALGAQAGGAPKLKASIRVVIWGILAMAATWAIGWLVGTTL